MPPNHKDLKAMISNALSTILTTHKAPSIAIAIASRNGLHTICSGIRKEGSPTQITPNDTFMLGPITSTFVPLILSRLIDLHYFKWTDTISTLLPTMPMHPLHKETTVQMLACHISGIVTKFPELEDGRLATETIDLNGQEGRRRTVLSALHTAPERPIKPYRNAINLLLLTYIAETVTKKPWNELLSLYIQPLIDIPSLGLGRLDFSQCPRPHLPDGKPLEEKTPWLDCEATYPALGAHCTLPDLATYLEYCLLENQRNPELYDISDGKFALGGFDQVCEEGKNPMLRCAGHVSGFSTGMWLTDLFGVAVIVNLDGKEGAAARDELGKLAMEILG